MYPFVATKGHKSIYAFLQPSVYESSVSFMIGQCFITYHILFINCMFICINSSRSLDFFLINGMIFKSRYVSLCEDYTRRHTMSYSNPPPPLPHTNTQTFNKGSVQNVDFQSFSSNLSRHIHVTCIFKADEYKIVHISLTVIIRNTHSFQKYSTINMNINLIHVLLHFSFQILLKSWVQC